MGADSTALTLLPARSLEPARVRLSRALGRPGRLRFGDRVRVSGGRFKVLRRGSAPSFGRLDALTEDARRSALEAASALDRIAALPLNIAGTSNLVAFQEASALRERLNLMNNRLSALSASLEDAIDGVRSAFGARAERSPELRSLLGRALRPLEDRLAAARAASPGLESGVYDLDTRLSLIPHGPLELPIGTVGTLTQLIQELIRLL